MKLSIAFFASGEQQGDAPAPSKYDYFLEAVRFADRTGTCDETLLIIQHPDGRPLKTAFGKVASKSDRLITYEVNTEPGSSGSPVILNDWRVAALHHRAHETQANEGVAFAPILKRLREKGFAGALGPELL
jgi:hypothetical protein